MLTTICFDADDTLWHNERFFRMTEDRFAELLANHADGPDIRARLLEAERRNIGHYGFGIKGFVLSMIETALDVTERRVPGEVIAEILNAGQEMLRHPIELLPGAEESVRALASEHDLLLITKGDLLDQERKLAQSGLGDLFDGVEIVSEKSRDTYESIFFRHAVPPDRALMAGNSLKSDINPALAAGAWAVHIPHDLGWDLEHDDAPEGHPRYRTAASLDELPGIIATLSN